jgi:cell wall-associated NlpC family hydrolase
VVAACLVFAGALAVGVAQFAGAAPVESISQVKAQVNADQSKLDKAQQQYDKDNTQLTAAKNRLNQINSEVAADNARYQTARKKVVQIATAGYEDSEQTDLAGLLSANDPATVLSEASIITELTGSQNQLTARFLGDAQQLSSVQQDQQRTENGIQQVTSQAKAAKNSAQADYNHEKSILDGLDAAQQAQVDADTVGGGGGANSGAVANPVDNVPTNSEAGVAVAYVIARAQLGSKGECPYLYGGTGPCSVGYDCSGLVMQAWASAGVTIPRDTYSQWAALPHVSLNDLEPGDLIYYDGEGHVAMYVGGGMIVDAPQTGLQVEEIPRDTSWYAENEDGAVRP